MKPADLQKALDIMNHNVLLKDLFKYIIWLMVSWK